MPVIVRHSSVCADCTMVSTILWYRPLKAEPAGTTEMIRTNTPARYLEILLHREARSEPSAARAHRLAVAYGFGRSRKWN